MGPLTQSFTQIRPFEWHDPVPMCKFVVFGRPATAGSKDSFGRDSCDRKRADGTKDYGKRWRAMVKAECLRQCRGLKPIEKPVAVGLTVEFVFPAPKKQFAKDGKWRTDAPLLKTSFPDCDKMQRALGDALKGVVYDDDAQIAVWIVRKTFGHGVGFEGAAIVEAYRLEE